MLQEIVFFVKVTLYSVTIVIKLPQKHQYIHLTVYIFVNWQHLIEQYYSSLKKLFTLL